MLRQEPFNFSQPFIQIGQPFINPGDVPNKLGLVVHKVSHGLL